MRHKKLVAIAAAGLLALTLGACGSPTSGAGNSSKADKAATAAQKAYDEIAALSGPEREKTLVEKAEKEGMLSLYTSNVSMDDIIDLFKKKYDLDVDVYLGTSESVLQRALQEHKANYFGSDVIEGNGTALNVMGKDGLFADYESAARDALPEVAQADGWTASRFAVFATAWNTDLLKPADEPKTFEELADPKYKGKLSMELSDTDWYYTMQQHFLEEGKSKAEVDELFKKIVENSTVAKGHTQQAEFLAAGQFAICVACYTDAIDRGSADGAPVSWHKADGKPLEPLVIRTSGTGMLKTSQHPYAALLFQDFMLGDEVQQLMTDDHRVGTVPRADDPLKGFKTLPIDDDAVLKISDKLQADYATLLRNAKG